MSGTTYFYAAVGARLTVHQIDVDGARLIRGSSVEAQAPVQYAWPHPSRNLLYVASSDGGPGRAGSNHWAQAFSIEPTSGALSATGEPRRLDSRPIHCTVDPSGRFLLLAYNHPSGVSVHALAPDGQLGECVDAHWDVGIYAHQVRVTPGGEAVIVATRGNDATAQRAEEPGSLAVFSLRDGRLEARGAVTPNDSGGLGFGPRHLDFHPSEPWAVVSVERQDELHVYRLGADGTPEAAPLHVVDALLPAIRRSPPGPQLACAVHVHPSGAWVYQANRTDGRGRRDGWAVGFGGEDSLVVYALQDRSIGPQIVQRLRLPTIHMRTFSIHPGGRLLVGASIQPVPLGESDGSVRLVPAALCVYRIAHDGRLTLARTYDVNTGADMMFWTGMVTVSGA